VNRSWEFYEDMTGLHLVLSVKPAGAEKE